MQFIGGSQVKSNHWQWWYNSLRNWQARQKQKIARLLWACLALSEKGASPGHEKHRTNYTIHLLKLIPQPLVHRGLQSNTPGRLHERKHLASHANHGVPYLEKQSRQPDRGHQSDENPPF